MLIEAALESIDQWRLSPEVALELLRNDIITVLDVPIRGPEAIEEMVASGMSRKAAEAEYLSYLSQQLAYIADEYTLPEGETINRAREVFSAVQEAVDNGTLERTPEIDRLLWEFSHPIEREIQYVIVDGNRIPFSPETMVVIDDGVTKRLIVDGEDVGIITGSSEKVTDPGGVIEKLQTIKWLIDHPEEMLKNLPESDLAVCGLSEADLYSPDRDMAAMQQCVMTHQAALIKKYYERIVELQGSFGR